MALGFSTHFVLDFDRFSQMHTHTPTHANTRALFGSKPKWDCMRCRRRRRRCRPCECVYARAHTMVLVWTRLWPNVCKMLPWFECVNSDFVWGDDDKNSHKHKRAHTNTHVSSFDWLTDWLARTHEWHHFSHIPFTHSGMGDTIKYDGKDRVVAIHVHTNTRTRR